MPQALFKVANYCLDDSEKTNDESFYEFVEFFKFLLKLKNLSYLVEKDSQGKDKDVRLVPIASCTIVASSLLSA